MKRRMRRVVLGLLPVCVIASLSFLPLAGQNSAGAATDALSATLVDDPPIVDDFNRADENPLSDSGRWSYLNGYPLAVVSNQLATASGGTAQVWRNDVRYGLDQEVAVTISAKPGDGMGRHGDWVRLYVRLQLPSMWEGYALRFANNTTGTDLLILERFTGGAATTLQSFGAELTAGTTIRLRAIGSSIEAWVGGPGSWTMVGSVTDSTYLGVGYVALGLRGTVGRLDDFRAASLREPVPDSVEPLDDFNRADEQPLSDGGAWSQLNGYQLMVVSNQLACSQSGSTCQSWRNDVRFGPDQEAWATIETKPEYADYDAAWIRMYVRLQRPSMFEGYALRYNNWNGVDQILLERFDGGAPTVLASFNQEILQGDKLKIRAVGSTIEAWRRDNNLGAWVKLGEAVDSRYLGVGYVGVGIRRTSARLDDFGAATLREPIPDTTVPIDDFNRPDEQPLSDSGAWSSLNGYQLKVVSNQLACSEPGATCQAWRSDASYGSDQEVWATMETEQEYSDYDAAWVRLYVRLQKPAEFDGYALRFNNRPGVDELRIERFDNGTPAPLATFNQEVVIGDKLRLRAIGSTIEAWHRGSGSGIWVKLGEAADSTYVASGYLGVGIRRTTGRLDDFGGGSTSPSFGDQVLLERFAPELRFTSDETYRADSAGIATDLWFSEPYRTTVLKHIGSGDAYAAADPSSELDDLSLDYLSTQAFPFDYLSQPDWFPDDIAQAAIDYTQWVAEHPDDRRRAYGRVVTDPGGSGEKILQYWLYYYYNSKNFLGIGKHEGDWEWIQVRLDANNSPIRVALSQHGYGEKCDWGPSVEISTSGRPIVYVAYESHANYFWAGTHPLDNRPDDVTRDDGVQYREVPSIVNVTTPPGWILWNGQWGDSFGSVNSPQSPGIQPPWSDPWTWENDSNTCTQRPSLASQARSSESQSGNALADRSTPPLPRILSVRVTATKYGKAVRVRYCFRSMPTDPGKRPSRMHLTLENLRDKLPPLSVGWKVNARCGTILHPVGPIKPPYLLRYSVESRRGTWSKRAQIRLR